MTKAKNNSYCLVLAFAVIVAAAGCKKKEQPPQAPPPKPVVMPVAPVQKPNTSAKLPGQVDSALDFTRRKDPFKPFVEPPQTAKPAPVARGRVRTEDPLPIQMYEVSQFKVSGIITGMKENTALILDPTGKGYVVREGMLLGSNDGRIAKIGPSSLQVVEQYRDDNGHNRKRTVVLSLLKKK